MSDKIGRALTAAGSGVWLGALVLLGVGVAPVLFRLLPRDLAGAVNAVILHRLNLVEAVSAGLIVLGLAVRWIGGDRSRRWMIDAALAVGLIGLLAVYAGLWAPELNGLRALLDTSAAAKARFDTLHHGYTKLVGVNVFLSLGLLVRTATAQPFFGRSNVPPRSA